MLSYRIPDSQDASFVELKQEKLNVAIPSVARPVVLCVCLTVTDRLGIRYVVQFGL